MTINILGINGSPRSKSNTAIILDRALQGAASVSGVCVETYNFCDKDFCGCKATCMAYCLKNGKCTIKDDFNQFMELYLKADGVLWAAPVYHAGPPGQVKCVMDRLGNVLFSYFRRESPRLNKACGAIVQGSSRWGGQELALQSFINHFVLMKCVPVTGDMPKSYFGVAGYAPTWKPGSICEDQLALMTAENTGIRVAEMAKILKDGTEQQREELPDVYFLDKILEKRRNREETIDMEWEKK